MAQITFTTKACSNWIPVDNRVSKNTRSMVIEVEDLVAHIKCNNFYLNELIKELKVNLSRSDFKTWLKENRKEFRDTVYLMSALDPLSTDSDEMRTKKLLIGAKLIEIIES